jgi:DNA-binding CsgD family transcriptional regulator
MDFSTKYFNIIFRKQKILEFIAVLIMFVAIGFRFGIEGPKWFWDDAPFIALILVMAGLLLSLLWIRIEKHKTQLIIDKIKNSNKNNSNSMDAKIKLLTNRQCEIFELIIKGKSNKEIMDKLFIELSTLKTHINHIYKTLEIGNRKEAKAIGTDRF